MQRRIEQRKEQSTPLVCQKIPALKVNDSGKTLVYIVTSGIYQWTNLAPTLHWFVIYSSSAVHFLGVCSDRNHCFVFEYFTFSFSFSESIIVDAWYFFCLDWNQLSHALLSGILLPDPSLFPCTSSSLFVILRLTISKICTPLVFFSTFLTPYALE